MQKTVQAIYENGVLRPLDPLPLEEHQQVTVSVSDSMDASDALSGLLIPISEWTEVGEALSHEQVRLAMSTIEGTLADAVIEERRERW